MRRNVQGTVTLYAIIRSDGSVGDVRVLQGVDDRLDAYARAALTHWRFQPATKNGNAVDLEAVVAIPFRVSRTRSGLSMLQCCSRRPLWLLQRPLRY